MAVWALLLIASTADIGVYLEERGGLSAEVSGAVVGALAEHLEAQAPGAVAIADPTWAADCREAHRCVDGLRAHLRVGHVVILRIFGGVTRVRVVAEVFRGSSATPQTIEADLDAAAPERSRSLEEIATKILAALPRLQAHGSAIAHAPRVEPPAPRPVAPWILVASGAVAAGVGAVLVSSSGSANAQLSGYALTAEEYDRLAGRRSTHGVAGGLLIGAGSASLVAGVIWLLVH